MMTLKTHEQRVRNLEFSLEKARIKREIRDYESDRTSYWTRFLGSLSSAGILSAVLLIFSLISISPVLINMSGGPYKISEVEARDIRRGAEPIIYSLLGAVITIVKTQVTSNAKAAENGKGDQGAIARTSRQDPDQA